MKAWLELFRISNLPTVWSNLAAGAALGWMMSPDSTSFSLEMAFAILCVMIAGSCLYTGGMVLNDVFDVAVDHDERPSRPIPSGRISLGSAARVGSILLILGIGMAALAGKGHWPVVIIATTIALLSVVYDATHLRSAISILPLSICRGLLYPLGGLAINSTEWDFSVMLIFGFIGLFSAAHTIALSLVARGEAEPPFDSCSSCEQPLLETQENCPECGVESSDFAIGNRPHLRQQGINQLLGLVTFVLGIPGLMYLVSSSMLHGSEYGTVAWPFPAIGVLGSTIILVWGLRQNQRNLHAEPPRLTAFILGSIAAFCLYDAVILCMIGSQGPIFALFAYSMYFIVRRMHRRIPGT